MRDRIRKYLLTGKSLLVIAILLSCTMVHGTIWKDKKEEFTQNTKEGLEVNPEGKLILSKINSQYVSSGIYRSRIFQGGICFFGWVGDEPKSTAIKVEIRSSSSPFAPEATTPQWNVAENSVLLNPMPYFQYRITLSTTNSSQTASVREVLVSSETLVQTFTGKNRPQLRDLVINMLYGVTAEKLYAVYNDLSCYDASERGMYIYRNSADAPITPTTYQYKPQQNEMYLPMSHGTWLIMRIHPFASFSPLSIKPRPVVYRSKTGKEKEAGPLGQSHSFNFFDQDFINEYKTGVAAAVSYYKQNNPYVLGYTLMPPEFFYDTIPWPEMTFLGGFGDLAKKNYQRFMSSAGASSTQWPQVSDGDVALSPEYYLWAFWRSWAGAHYMNEMADVIKQNDPLAQVGTMHYLGAQSLRGLEPAFVEENPNFDFNYSSNMYPRVPSADGHEGGKIFSYTRQNIMGHSQKFNLLEYDLFSPYIDRKRALTYARYASLQGIMPVSFIMGDYPTGNQPANHLTKYHGMKGERLTPEVLTELANNIRQTAPLRTTQRESQVAVILPSISLFSILEKDRWIPHRYQQLNLNVLDPLLKLGVDFDLLTEGYAKKDILDKYKLVIVFQPAIYPWMRKALRDTTANLLVLGWAGTIAPPGPIHQISDPIVPENFSLQLSHAWPTHNRAGQTVFPSLGRIKEEHTAIQFSNGPHLLLRGLENLSLDYQGQGLNGRALPFVTGLTGESLAKDSNGENLFSVLTDNRTRKIIHFGGLMYFRNREGKEVSLFTETQEKQLFSNVFNFIGIEYYSNLKDLRVMRTSHFLMIENTSEDTIYSGPVPQPQNKGNWNIKTTQIEIKPYDSVIIPITP